jgi:HAD superfamily hydrolase (TIGR01509 family)
MQKIEAVLLDVDGTLLDSNDLHAKAWFEAVQDWGFDVPFEMVRSMIGMGGDKIIPRLTHMAGGSEEAADLGHFRGVLFQKKYLPKVKAFPKAREFLMALKHQGLDLVVATSAESKELNALLKQGGIEDLLVERTTSSDAERSKPDPDIVNAALKRVGVKPKHAIMIGDTPYDVEAALDAGIPIIALRSGGWEDKDLHGAVAIYDDVADLLKHFATSPLVDDLEIAMDRSGPHVQPVAS